MWDRRFLPFYFIGFALAVYFGVDIMAVTVLAVWATEGDITIAVITVPLGLMCLFSKKMLIVDNYYFEAEKGQTWE